MNLRSLRPWGVATAALLIPLAALGKQSVPFGSGPSTRATATISSGPKWLESTIDIDINRATIVDGIRAVLAAAKVSVEGVESELELPRDTRVSLSATRVKVRDALAAIARLGGAIAYVAETDGRVTIQLRKRTDTGTFVVPLPPGSSGFGLSGSNTFPGGSNFTVTTNLPALAKRISIDRRDADLRDSLRDVLKQALVDFSLEADIPDDVRKSFTFDNVPLRDALNLMCQSGEIAWRIETSNGKPLVRIGKQFGRPASR